MICHRSHDMNLSFSTHLTLFQRDYHVKDLSLIQCQTKLSKNYVHLIKQYQNSLLSNYRYTSITSTTPLISIVLLFVSLSVSWYFNWTNDWHQIDWESSVKIKLRVQSVLVDKTKDFSQVFTNLVSSLVLSFLLLFWRVFFLHCFSIIRSLNSASFRFINRLRHSVPRYSMTVRCLMTLLNHRPCLILSRSIFSISIHFPCSPYLSGMNTNHGIRPSPVFLNKFKPTQRRVTNSQRRR